MKVIFVGSNRVKGDGIRAGFDDQYALYPYDNRSSGARLMKICGLTRETFLDNDIVGRVNLCGRLWSWSIARETVAQLQLFKTPLVLLGKLTAEAFGTNLAPFTARPLDGQMLVSLPHPSGMNREWNEPRNVKRARNLLKKTIPEMSWGDDA